MNKRLEISHESLYKIQDFVAEEEVETNILSHMTDLFHQIGLNIDNPTISSDDLEDWHDILTRLAARAPYLSLYFGKIADMSDVKLVIFEEDED